jgi:GNAT superfamily N-acetyltransferase
LLEDRSGVNPPPVLRLASEAEKRARDELTFQEWAAGLTPEGYVERERRLRAHTWARASMRTWLLEEGGEIVSSCETFAVPSLHRGERGTTHEVASVFTEPRLRGKGHAGRMMKRLVKQLREESPEAHAVVLFSDVGAGLYERAGFVTRPAVDWVYPPRASTAKVEWLKHPPEVSLKGALALQLSAEQLDWHLERERIYADQLRKPRPDVCGASVGNSRIVWACNFKSNSLVVLALEAATPDEAKPLMESAQATAHAVGLNEVRCWESALPMPPGGRREERKGSLPMLCPLHPAVKPESWEDIPRGCWV